MTLSVYPGMLFLLWLAHVLGCRLLWALMPGDDPPLPWLAAGLIAFGAVAVGVVAA